jgi:hypothetical protein
VMGTCLGVLVGTGLAECDGRHVVSPRCRNCRAERVTCRC